MKYIQNIPYLYGIIKTNTAMQTTEKKQTAKLSGSFFNYLMGNNQSIPEVGKGATQMHYSDRSCYEVIEVSEDGKTVKLEGLDAKWDNTKPGGQGHQNWILEPTGRFLTVIWRNNAWRTVSKQIIWADEFYKNVIDPINRGSEEYKSIMNECFDSEKGKLKLVEGKTRLKTSYNKINLLFGSKNYYYDWSF